MKTRTPRQQLRNRRKLAHMLEHRVTDEQFNMRHWANDCGTVGCALGIAVLSGEFDGLGWNRPIGYRFILPVVGGAIQDWEDVGPAFFGGEAYEQVFVGNLRRTRKQVADALRAIKE